MQNYIHRQQWAMKSRGQTVDGLSPIETDNIPILQALNLGGFFDTGDKWFFHLKNRLAK